VAFPSHSTVPLLSLQMSLTLLGLNHGGFQSTAAVMPAATLSRSDKAKPQSVSIHGRLLCRPPRLSLRLLVSSSKVSIHNRLLCRPPRPTSRGSPG
jgi:hypothetical protein